MSTSHLCANQGHILLVKGIQCAKALNFKDTGELENEKEGQWGLCVKGWEEVGRKGRMLHMPSPEALMEAGETLGSALRAQEVS